MADEVKRIDIGFIAQVLTVKATQAAYDELISALSAENRGGWHTVKTQDSEVVIDLAHVSYVRRDTEEHRVGF